MLAGIAARAGVGVGSLEEAVHALEKSHERGNISYRFALRDGKILAQVQRQFRENVTQSSETYGWRTLVELVS